MTKNLQSPKIGKMRLERNVKLKRKESKGIRQEYCPHTEKNDPIPVECERSLKYL